MAEEPEPLRIVRRLAREHPGVSASRLKRAVEEGQVTVNGAVADDPGLFVKGEDEVAWDPNRKVRRRVDASIEVLYEDDDAIAVVKPAGLLTHPTEAKERDTLQSRVSTYVARRQKGRAFLAVVHRLDKETSGCLVFARSRRALVTLQAQLRAHSMDRSYLAVAEGSLTGDRGTYDRDLVGDGTVKKRGVAAPGEEGVRAITEWTVVERFGIATLAEVRLKTGRTHQIRIHFAFSGHPLVGDSVYRDSRRPPFPVPFPRQALHAGRLGWTNPDGSPVLVEAPPPADFQKLVEAVRKRSSARPKR